MTKAETLRRLAALAAPTLPEDPHQEARTAARALWVRRTMAALKAAQQRATDAWDKIMADLPDDIDDDELEALPDPPEQAEVDALWEVVNAVVEKDRWPAHLYFSGV